VQRVETEVALRHAIQHADYALDDVIDVGEIPCVVAVVEHFDRFAGENLLSEQEQRHVGPTPRAVHGEKAQAGRRKAV